MHPIAFLILLVLFIIILVVLGILWRIVVALDVISHQLTEMTGNLKKISSEPDDKKAK